jgi:hypothetical protein
MQKKPFNILTIIAKEFNPESDDKIENIHSEILLQLTSQFQKFDRIKKYKLAHDEVMIIASAWHEYIINRNSNIDAIDILKKLFDDTDKQILYLEKIIKLLYKNVFYTTKKEVKIRNENLNSKGAVINFNMLSLFEYNIEFHHRFLKSVLNIHDDSEVDSVKPYTSNREFLDDWFQYVEKIYDSSLNSFSRSRFRGIADDMDVEDILESQEWAKKIESRLINTEKKFPLMEIQEEYNLDKNEITILIYLIKEELEDRSCSVDELAKLVSNNVHDLYRNKAYLSDNSKLVLHGLVELSEGVFFVISKSDIRVAPDVMRRIIMRNPVNDDEKLNQILRGNDLFTVVEPTQTFEDLILPSDMKHTIKSSLQQYNANVDNILENWGLYDKGLRNSYSKAVKTEPGMLMLFYGASGTGKTFAAGAIAQALGKKLVITDISKIQSKWVGDSEKNVRKIFSVYERIVMRVSNPPVLLLNEADQFLMKRTNNANSSVDKMMNSMQNLFLEAFENLRGVLIATTNLRTNLDNAFSRRFHLKLEFPYPGIKERISLWKLHLPVTIPGVEDIDTKLLAEKYLLTGGQIKIIIRNAAVEAAARKGRFQRLLINDLIKYSEIEASSVVENKRVVGFNRR